MLARRAMQSWKMQTLEHLEGFQIDNMAHVNQHCSPPGDNILFNFAGIILNPGFPKLNIVQRAEDFSSFQVTSLQHLNPLPLIEAEHL